MNFGGPVWHASAAVLPGQGSLSGAALRVIARNLLLGVGDPGLGEWEELGERAFHVRRRLTPEEARPAVDIRRNPEARQRINAVALAQPAVPLAWLLQELVQEEEGR
jgi:hypothetical protein